MPEADWASSERVVDERNPAFFQYGLSYYQKVGEEPKRQPKNTSPLTCTAVMGQSLVVGKAGDGDDCTEDGCDSVNGCFNTPLPEGAACPGGTCQSGVCVPEGTDGGVDGGVDGGQDAGADEGKPSGGGCGCGTGTIPTGSEFVLVLIGLLFIIRRKVKGE